MAMSSDQIRSGFIDFFTRRGHQFVPSSPVVPHNDPTLLFTNAGMNQFKAIFLGENPSGMRRAANSQKCMRVSGKHNDLEEVGRDHHHHTFFEMLGNWSFGDYYKEEAIVWAWELLTHVWQLPRERLFVTIHHNDTEAAGIWKSRTDIDPRRIMTFGDKENFWEMGETGPCGPCSEIHYDMGDDATREATFADAVLGVNGKNDRYREIWNLVFMQYNRGRDGSLSELPAKNVDTGMGFERVVALIQGVGSNYETDVLRSLIARTGELCARDYHGDERGVAFRVIADHIRALTFAITDGAFPSNEGRGYVVRRLLRRAVRFGRDLGFSEPFLHLLVPEVATLMGGAFPEVRARAAYCSEVIRAEEERFGQTLEQGMERFSVMVGSARDARSTVLKGEDVFQLYDTYGFPMDLTRLMAREQGLEVDETGFETAMASQRSRAREAAKKGGGGGLSADGWNDCGQAVGTSFTGYENTEGEARVYRFKILGDGNVLLVLDATPFYAESGGQVGDTGVITTAGGKVIRVVDTVKWNDTTVHRGVCDVPLQREDFEHNVRAGIDTAPRAATRRNHTATHLLQAALREVLGDHVQQSGSRVDSEGLRFDFTHFQGVSRKELERIEELVNGWILEDLPVATTLERLDDARARGATALFGEKYNETVRVVALGAISTELCGGTHVARSAQIGLFHITGESSISAGVRRIEGVTGLGTLQRLLDAERVIGNLTQQLKVPGDRLQERVRALGATVRDLEERLAKARGEQAGAQVGGFFDQASDSGSFPFLVTSVGSVDKETFARMADALGDELKQRSAARHAFVVGGVVEGKAQFFACAAQQTVRDFGVHCGELVKVAARVAGGGGGGSPVRAQAGGRDGDKLEEALDAAKRLLEQKSGI